MTTLANGNRAWRARLIEQGEMVPNAPFRARLEWLQEHDPEFSLTQIVDRLIGQGFTSYRRLNGGRMRNDTSRLRRNLGMRPQSRGHGGGLGKTTTHISYELAVALCYALEMDPHEGDV